MEPKSKQIYEFGPFRLDAGERILLRDGEPVRLRHKDGAQPLLTPKVVETLVALVEREGQIVSKDQLMKAVWPDTVVEEGNLSANISLLRKALGTSAEGEPYIETFPKRGYRFTANVRRLSDETDVRTEAQTSPLATHLRVSHPDASELRASPADSELVISKRTRTRVITRVESESGDYAVPVGRAILPPTAAVTLAERRALAKISKRSRNTLVAALLLLFSAVVISWLLLVRPRLNTANVLPPFSHINISRLTTNGVAGQAAISPDGQYVVHVTGGAGQQSLQLKHLADGTDQEIVPPGNESFSAVTFSRDGRYVYYDRFTEKEGGVLSEIPVLGGTPKVLAKDVDGCAAFSPDGKQFAFIRGMPVEGEAALTIAGIDGGERKLVTHNIREMFADASINAWGPAWSPDGSVIAFFLGAQDAQGNEYQRVMLARVADGTERVLTSEKWSSIGQITWLPDGSGLIVAAAEQQPDAPHQLWYIAYPGGTARRITNDLSNYDGVSLTNDVMAVVAVQSERRANIWIEAVGEESKAVQLPSDKNDGVAGLAWTVGERVVYTSTTSGNTDLWIMDGDGGNRRQLTTSPGEDHQPAVSSDGRYIVFVSERTGTPNVWRIDLDGRNPRQLTNQHGDYFPHCSPDNRWVVYATDTSGRRQLWKVPLDGGVPEAVTNFALSRHVISPDGKFIAGAYLDESGTPRRYTTAIIPFDGSRPIKTFDFPRSFAQAVRWTPDSRALTYLVTRAGVSNIWRQALEGGAPVALTEFKAETIFDYDWSRDGKLLAMARGSVISDVVLIKNIR